MPAMEIFILFLLAALAWLWHDSLNAREAAVRAARDACTADGLMLLDDTVAIAALKPARDAEGRLKLQRVYDFEYTDNGDNRHSGSVIMLGRRVVLFNVGFRERSNVRTLH
jgi:hypothetical protein